MASRYTKRTLSGRRRDLQKRLTADLAPATGRISARLDLVIDAVEDRDPQIRWLLGSPLFGRQSVLLGRLDILFGVLRLLGLLVERVDPILRGLVVEQRRHKHLQNFDASAHGVLSLFPDDIGHTGQVDALGLDLWVEGGEYVTGRNLQLLVDEVRTDVVEVAVVEEQLRGGLRVNPPLHIEIDVRIAVVGQPDLDGVAVIVVGVARERLQLDRPIHGGDVLPGRDEMESVRQLTCRAAECGDNADIAGGNDGGDAERQNNEEGQPGPTRCEDSGPFPSRLACGDHTRHRRGSQDYQKNRCGHALHAFPKVIVG